MRAELKSDVGEILTVFELSEATETLVSGNIKHVINWESNGSPLYFEFFAHCLINWDGCSHFSFNGEDYIEEHGNETDSHTNIENYYHICGLNHYVRFMRTLAFAYEVMAHYVGIDKMLEKEKYKELKLLGLLNGYTISYYPESA